MWFQSPNPSITRQKVELGGDRIQIHFDFQSQGKSVAKLNYSLRYNKQTEFSHVIERDFCHNVLNKNLNFAAVINLVNLFFHICESFAF